MTALTPRQEQVLRFVAWSITTRDYPPSLREICNQVGIRGTNGANDHLLALERKGMLRRTPMISRGITLTAACLEYLASNPEPVSEQLEG